jgi:hypothetical protein
MRAPLLLAAALVLAGCQALPSGGRSVVRFVSEPAGATVTLSSGETCVTPCQLSVSRRDDFVATFALRGHVSHSVQVVSEPPGRLAGGISPVPGLRVGIVNQTAMADPAGTFMREHRPNPVVVRLQPSGGAASQAPPPAR